MPGWVWVPVGGLPAGGGLAGGRLPPPSTGGWVRGALVGGGGSWLDGGASVTPPAGAGVSEGAVRSEGTCPPGPPTAPDDPPALLC